MDTIHHYLGRIAEGEGHVQEAMRYYVEASRYLQMFAQEPRARLAFYHLRLGELLISASLVEQARDHLLLSQEIFDAIQFSSSGRLQVSLAWAALSSKEGNYARAREYVLAANYRPLPLRLASPGPSPSPSYTRYRNKTSVVPAAISALINPPGYAPAAFVLLAELHGRIGHFPTLVRL